MRVKGVWRSNSLLINLSFVLLFCQEKHIVRANLRLVLMPLWVLFCPAELSSVGLIMVVILLGTSRAAQEMGSPWKSRDGWRSADVLFSCLQAFTCSETAPRQKEAGCSDQPLWDWRVEVRRFHCCLPLVSSQWWNKRGIINCWLKNDLKS